ncbi:MAG: hypothetical protein B7Y41_16035 [Hydrogenophilales bacterium 28-61-23]|nr:MAG: hypothetical protein B7Y41_16035 [Hydrogenophilales bacterium 28-61-23]
MYAHIVELALPIDQAIEKLKAALTEAKMGVVSEVDVQAIMKAKIGHEIPPYRLLGVCAPGIAKAVIEADPDAGALLPCGCCVYETAPGNTRIALQDPGAIAKMADNAAITATMTIAQGHLAGVLAALKA